MNQISPPPEATDVRSRLEVDDTGLRVGTREWCTVLVLTVIILLSFVDRSALSLVASSVKTDLHITNIQLSYLLGTSFALFYSVVGIPSGYLVDRYNRRGIMFVAVVIWSSMTALCGFATSFSTLFIGRLGVGLGEAAVSPVAFSIIRDSFPIHLRARAMSVFYIGSACGTGAALLVVGALLGHIPAAGITNVPVFGTLKPWQLSLVIIGFCGFPISLLIWTMREPVRRKSIAATNPSVTFKAGFKHFWSARSIFLPLFIGYGFSGIGSAASNSWIPTYIIHNFGLTMHQTGETLGAIGVAGAFVGMISSGFFLDKISSRWGLAMLPIVGGITLTIAGLSWFCIQFVTSLSGLWVLLLFTNFITPWAAIAGSVTLSRATPGSMIGKFTAVFFLTWNLMGYGLGPTIVALITDHAGFKGPMALGHGISIGAGAAFVIAGLLQMTVSRGIKKSLGGIEA